MRWQHCFQVNNIFRQFELSLKGGMVFVKSQFLNDNMVVEVVDSAKQKHQQFNLPFFQTSFSLYFIKISDNFNQDSFDQHTSH